MLEIRSIFEDGVEINSPFRFVYGFRLDSGIEKYQAISNRLISLLLDTAVSSKDYRNGVIVQAFYRRKISNVDMKITEIYLFTFGEQIRDIIKTNLSGVYKQLKGGELADAIYRLQTLEDDIVLDLKEKTLKRNSEIFKDIKEQVNLQRFYKKIVRDSIDDLDNYAVYFGSKLTDLSLVNLTQLLLLNWEGVIWITFDLRDFTQYFEAQAMKNHPQYKTIWKELKEANRRIITPIGVETFIIGKKDKIPNSIAVSIGSYLGFVMKEKKYEKYKILLETPLKYFDADYEFVDDISFVKNLLITGLERYKTPEKPLVIGHNIYKTYQAFNHFEEVAPHTLRIASTGSGKSVNIGLEITQILNLDSETLFQSEVLKTPPTRIRHFDKGYTAELFYKLLKLKGVDVFRISISPDKVRINPLEVIDEETDYNFAIEFTSLLLASLGEEGLKKEKIPFNKIHKILTTNKEYCYALNLTVEELGETNPAIYNQLKQDGFKDDDYIKDIVNKNPEKYYFLSQPTYSDMFRFITNLPEDSMLIEDEEVLKSLKRKLQIITEIEQFNTISEFSLKDAQIIVVDMDKLEVSPYFVPIIASLLKKLFYYDKYNKPSGVYAFYYFDEAHTLLRYEEFSKLLEIGVREARKFKISLNFATQTWKEIPPAIIKNIPNRIFLSPKDTGKGETSKKEILLEYANHLGLDLEKDLKDLYDIFSQLPPFYSCIEASSGLFSFKMPTSKAIIDLFSVKDEEPYFIIPNSKIALVRDIKKNDAKVKELEKQGFIIY